MGFRLRSALPHHSPACIAVPLDKRIPQELPRQSVEGRSGSIIVPMQHRRALPATARSGKAVDRSEVRHRAGFHAAPPHGNVPVHQYAIVKVQAVEKTLNTF